MAMLEVNNIHTYYGNIHALKGISITVEENEIAVSYTHLRAHET